MKTIKEWAGVVALVIFAITQVSSLFGGLNFGASGTRMPNGISADTTSPIAGEVRGTTLTITGATTLSSTLAVSGATTLSSTLAVSATTTLSANLIMGSSTPMSVASGSNFVAINGSSGAGTSTLYLVSPHGTKGGCIQMESASASTTFRFYATTTGYAWIELGTCLDLP